MARHAARLNGADEIALTKLDVLSGLPTLQVATHYEQDGQRYRTVPPHVGRLAKPVYTNLPGWEDSIEHIRAFEDLPKEARAYVEMIEDETKTRVSLISVGPERNQNIIRAPF